MESSNFVLPGLSRCVEVHRLWIQPIWTRWELCTEVGERLAVPACSQQAVGELCPVSKNARLPRVAMRTERRRHGRAKASQLPQLLAALIVAVLPCPVTHADIIRQAQRLSWAYGVRTPASFRRDWT
jgi:hypothetical protein